MATKLSIDGVIFVGKSDISSWTPTPLAGGIRVEWTPDDVEIIEGTNWNPSTSSENITVASSLFSWNTFSGYTFNFCPRPNTVDGTIHRVDLFALSGINNAHGTYQLAENFSLQTDYGAGNVASGGTINVRLFHKYGCHFSETSVNWAAFQLTGRFWLYFQSQKKRITSNLGGFSERETTIAPDVSLLAGVCGLVVNYADGSQSPILEFPQCPQDVFLVEDEICQNVCNLANSIINKLG